MSFTKSHEPCSHTASTISVARRLMVASKSFSTRGVNADITILRYRVCFGGSIISIMLPTPNSGDASLIMIPPPSRDGDFSDEYVCQSRDTDTTSSYLVTTQNPSPSMISG